MRKHIRLDKHDGYIDTGHGRSEHKPAVSDADRWLARRLLRLIGDPPVAFRLWNGHDITPGQQELMARLFIHHRKALLKLTLDPEFNFGELYTSGDIAVEGDLIRFLKAIYDATHFADPSFFQWALEKIQHYRNYRLPIHRTRENIQHHYDIGNDFYEKWLDDEVMQYTCAYYPDPTMTLEQAQTAKLHHVCRKLQLRPGLQVVEAGCGWGGLALFMAREYGVQVKAYNISSEQIQHARKQAAESGLSDRVEFIEDDYRNMQGRFDRFVSVGMLEHIGIKNFEEFGQIISRVMKEDGFGLIHSIGRNRPSHLNSWIARRIFPGACPPSIRQMMSIFETQMFSVLDVENLRLHYARTLEDWLERFEQHQDYFRQRFDEEFIRTWRLYLAGSIAAFRSGTLQLFQVVFSHPQNNALPSSRLHIYKDGQA